MSLISSHDPVHSRGCYGNEHIYIENKHSTRVRACVSLNLLKKDVLCVVGEEGAELGYGLRLALSMVWACWFPDWLSGLAGSELKNCHLTFGFLLTSNEIKINKSEHHQQLEGKQHHPKRSGGHHHHSIGGREEKRDHLNFGFLLISMESVIMMAVRTVSGRKSKVSSSSSRMNPKAMAFRMSSMGSGV